MTVIRLSGGGLFVHSPVALDTATQSAIRELGEVQAVVAPSIFHRLTWRIGSQPIRAPSSRRQVDRILEWPIDPVVLSHGGPLSKGGRDARTPRIRLALVTAASRSAVDHLALDRGARDDSVGRLEATT